MSEPQTWEEFVAGLVWRCDACGDERDDKDISVLKRSALLPRNVPRDVRLKYCNDRPACKELAEEKAELLLAGGPGR